MHARILPRLSEACLLDNDVSVSFRCLLKRASALGNARAITTDLFVGMLRRCLLSNAQSITCMLFLIVAQSSWQRERPIHVYSYYDCALDTRGVHLMLLTL